MAGESGNIIRNITGKSYKEAETITKDASKGALDFKSPKENTFYGKDGGKKFADYEAKKEEKVESKLIKNAYWSDKYGKKINCLLYSVKTVYVLVNLLQGAKGKKISITYKEYNSVSNTKLNRDTDYIIPNDNLQQLCPIAFTINDYTIEDEDDIAEYIFEIKIDNGEYSNEEKLRVHAVIYIPEIMKSLGWNYAFKSQEDWFNGKKNNYPWESKPKIDDFTMGWALSFERFKKRYNENLNKWKNSQSLESLKKEIGKMVKDGYATYPSSKNTITTFGLNNIASAELVDSIIKPEEFKNEKIKNVNVKIPLFDKYYFTSVPYEESKFSDLDDFFGSIANCNIRFVAKGTLEFKSSIETEVTITELGIYIRDGFDYVGDQPLGYWSLKDKKTSKNILSGGNFRYINNESYRDYRKDSGMGEDFYRYSNIYIYKPNFKFKL
ncbi:DUF6402 family protein [Flavobacterium piscis]|uniref:Uncharacterized protein n=1 Tax=Flavobacterium piscis TaxID=1114874 RepID=A0ABU1YDL7_9FLAO|nr:DUF6402 family protein [Flavobacterium piscis]MDR7212193.1 hypothetical protein [Flavobacterium piscis]